MKIAIVGTGYVGLTTGACLSHHDIGPSDCGPSPRHWPTDPDDLAEMRRVQDDMAALRAW